VGGLFAVVPRQFLRDDAAVVSFADAAGLRVKCAPESSLDRPDVTCSLSDGGTPSGRAEVWGCYPGLRCAHPELPMWAPFGSEGGNALCALWVSASRRDADPPFGAAMGKGAWASCPRGRGFRRPAGCRPSFRCGDGERSAGILPAWEGLPQAGGTPTLLSVRQVPRGWLSIRLTTPCV
jgi:hypothetical protein